MTAGLLVFERTYMLHIVRCAIEVRVACGGISQMIDCGDVRFMCARTKQHNNYTHTLYIWATPILLSTASDRHISRQPSDICDLRFVSPLYSVQLSNHFWRCCGTFKTTKQILCTPSPVPSPAFLCVCCSEGVCFGIPLCRVH